MTLFGYHGDAVGTAGHVKCGVVVGVCSEVLHFPLHQWLRERERERERDLSLNITFFPELLTLTLYHNAS